MDQQTQRYEIKCFLVRDFSYLITTKKVEYRNMNLKTDYLIHLMHECLIKYFFTDESKFELWSIVLRLMYGKYYNFYVDYLKDIGFLKKSSGYYVGVKSMSYNLNLNLLDFKNIKRVKISDNILIKKINDNKINSTFSNLLESTIDKDVRDKMILDLRKVKIDRESSISLLKTMLDTDKIDLEKYKRNICSVENISINNPFFKFDDYGRMHTNFTVLKKIIRKSYLTINGESLCEIDIKNSQPLFLGLLMIKELPINRIKNSEEISRYLKLVSSGLIYEDILNRCGHSTFKNRDQIKTMIYTVFFGKNNINVESNKIFNDLYPTVYDFIIDYKNNHGDYKSLSHELQRMESDFIFNKVVKEVISINSNITCFTVHDSIVCAESNKQFVSEIFYKHKNNLFKNLDI